MKTVAKVHPAKIQRTEAPFFGKAPADTFFNHSMIQPKLSLGQPNDKYEQEADKMARKVVQRRTIKPLIQKEEEEKAPIENRREAGLNPEIDWNRIGLSFDAGYSRYSFSASAGLRNPLGAIGLLGLDPGQTYLDFGFSDDCNGFFQNAFLQVSHNQQSGGDLIDFENNETNIGLNASFRRGKTLFSPGVNIGLDGDQFRSFALSLSFSGGADTKIPKECKRTPRRTRPPVFTNPPDKKEDKEKPPGTMQTPALSPITINFIYNSTLWVEDSNEKIRMLVDLLTKIPSTNVILTGHASLEGKKKHNENLAEKRALAVKDWLVLGGIDSGRITTSGVGESTPVVLEPDLPASLHPDTEQLRTQNRRVVAYLFDTAGSFSSELSLNDRFLPSSGDLGSLLRNGIATPEQ